MIILWELKGRDDRRYSLFSWRARMALRHKGLEFETHPVCMTDKEAIAFSGGRTVPVIQDGHNGDMRVVRDSWKIAEYLEATYPERPTLFGGEIGRGLAHTFNVWVDRVLVPAMLPLVAADIHERVDPSDSAYFRVSMEKVLGTTLEETRTGRAEALRRLGRALEPLQAVLKRQPFLCGQAAAYADYAAFSVLQWARIMSPQQVLSPEDPLAAWRERVSGLFGGFAGRVPAP